MALVAALGPAVAVAADEPPAPGLRLGDARPARGIHLDLDGASLSLEEGWLFPVERETGRPLEIAFVGSGRFALAPPDAIEAGQLELFTGLARVDEAIDEAVLFVGEEAVADSLLASPAAPAPAPEVARARELLDGWRASGERRAVGVEQAIFVEDRAPADGRDLVVAWMHGEELDRFLFSHDPWEFEQISLGRFVPVEMGERERRRAERRIDKAQRKGRLIGLEVEDLGQWDSWISTSPAGIEGSPRRGADDFDVDHHQLAVEIAPRSLELSVEARLDLIAAAGGARVLPLLLSSDLLVASVRDAAGNDLPFDHRANRLVAILAEPLRAGGRTSVTLEYTGRIFDTASTSRVLRTTTDWYPRPDDWTDRSTFEVAFRWPRSYELVAGGRAGEREEQGRWRSQQRVLDLPASFFSFELGRFELHRTTAGEVPITVALDPTMRRAVRRDVELILETAREAVLYFAEAFGPYPFSGLTIVTMPRAYSQAPPGFVTLSWASALDTADHQGTEERWVLAHEIAHQWWGHAIGWESYRDQWISEAMANYAALLFVRNRGEGRRRGPTVGWQAALMRRSRDGRTVESLGPMVLGRRLESSRSPSGTYHAIVYRKGAVVLDMLARSFGEETFLRILGSMMRGVAGRSLSTEQFFDLVERITDTQLEAFTRQFIYSTGLPEVHYDYRTEPTADGRWRIEGEAWQLAPTSSTVEIVPLADGGHDVVRSHTPDLDVKRSILVVPVQAMLYDPDKEGGSEEPERTGNTVAELHLRLAGERTRFELTVPLEPKQVWLDRRGEVFGLFVSRHREPKRVLYLEGRARVEAGRPAEAVAKLEEALAAPLLAGFAAEADDDPKERERRARALDARIHWLLARIHLDAERVASAREAWEAGRGAWRDAGRGRRDLPSSVAWIGARLELRKGDPEGAYRLLRRHESSSREWLLTMAIVAHRLGEDEELAELVEAAEERGLDLDPLLGGGRDDR